MEKKLLILNSRSFAITGSTVFIRSDTLPKYVWKDRYHEHQTPKYWVIDHVTVLPKKVLHNRSMSIRMITDNDW